ncbi:winged helix DNA-binding domain-containing protein [Cylindrobasidium torrendii FP15055 ss-10]|uniref:Winged helix DNA-binding domain-containing protein n=1 Tax=Cylindrobasidium torrendii FP15055 ss-10 TaxID=1314674 RepID=A0A0D7AUS1_9AGAR|nr:winged helix DNA-binding domain-containing protein [Cylindrobasidium torrendii FP15055 ss-10]
MPPPADDIEASMPLVSDFVKRLYRLLEDPSVQHIVSWSPHGDTFMVKDINEFTASILPKFFKHSNFASFVRQLNKYDFHKIKTTDDGLYGEHCWTFHHPNFNMHNIEKLKHIRRKPPVPRSVSNPAASSSYQCDIPSNMLYDMQSQLDYLSSMQAETSSHIRDLDQKYDDMRVAMSEFQRNVEQQDQLMQALAQNFYSGALRAGPPPPQQQYEWYRT